MKPLKRLAAIPVYIIALCISTPICLIRYLAFGIDDSNEFMDRFMYRALNNLID